MLVKDLYRLLNDFYPSEALGFIRNDDILERRTLAVIVHEILLNILNENDETDISPAFDLKDIFECKVCLPHIAQVFVKGIMPAEGMVFNVRKEVSTKEAESIISRIFDKSLRIKPERVPASAYPVILTLEGLKELIEAIPVPIIIDIDVRSSLCDEDCYVIGNLKKIVNGKVKMFHIPMTQIIKNPYIIRNEIVDGSDLGTADLSYPLVIIGTDEECSFICAECLISAGYRCIYIVAFSL